MFGAALRPLPLPGRRATIAAWFPSLLVVLAATCALRGNLTNCFSADQGRFEFLYG